MVVPPDLAAYLVIGIPLASGFLYCAYTELKYGFLSHKSKLDSPEKVVAQEVKLWQQLAHERQRYLDEWQQEFDKKYPKKSAPIMISGISSALAQQDVAFRPPSWSSPPIMHEPQTISEYASYMTAHQIAAQQITAQPTARIIESRDGRPTEFTRRSDIDAQIRMVQSQWHLDPLVRERQFVYYNYLCAMRDGQREVAARLMRVMEQW